MYRPYERTLPPDYRALFERLLQRTATFCACVAIFALCVFAVHRFIDGSGRSGSEVAAVAAPTPLKR
jgi:hypothetical protein